MKKITIILFLIVSFSSLSQLEFQSKVMHVYDTADASIEVFVTNGSGSENYNYYWYDSNYNSIGNNSSIVSDLTKGVYFLKVEDYIDTNEDNYIYTYFWIGQYGDTVNFNVKPNSLFGKDAILSNLVRPGINNIVKNFSDHSLFRGWAGTHGGYNNDYRSLIHFQFNGLGSANIINASFVLKNSGNNDTRSSVAGKLFIVSEPWSENEVTWSNAPSYDASNYAVVANGWPATKTIDVTNIIQNNSSNFGWLYKLDSENPYRGVSYYSSDNDSDNLLPTLIITFSLPDLKTNYYSVKKRLDGNTAKVGGDKILRFQYNEEYAEQDHQLSYKIYNFKREVVQSNIDESLTCSYGENRFDLPLALDACGQYYWLEVTNEKDEKWLLRFKMPEGGSECAGAQQGGGSGS